MSLKKSTVKSIAFAASSLAAVMTAPQEASVSTERWTLWNSKWFRRELSPISAFRTEFRPNARYC